MRDHADGVSALMGQLGAQALGSEFEHVSDLLHYLGQVHDIGKYTDAFQNYLKASHAYKQKRLPERPDSAPHKQAAVLVARKQAVEALGDSLGKHVANYLGAILYGHHTGIPNASDAYDKSVHAWGDESIETILARYQEDHGHPLRFPDLGPFIHRSNASSVYRAETMLRMLHSILVDADHQDTERFYEPRRFYMRQSAFQPSLDLMLQALETYQKERKPGDNPVVQAHQTQVYQSCLQAAENPAGFFTLTAPTGVGKTCSSLAFALRHAARNNMRRVIYALPFTSITCQVASDFTERIFKDFPQCVLEHHSARTPDLHDERMGWRAIATENWDNPLVVTTTAQCFDSLFGNRPASARKIHNIARSVIVLDEVQALPEIYLKPILEMLRNLVEGYGCTVLLCTATQPELSAARVFADPVPLVRPIIEQPAPLFESMRRVKYEYRRSPCSWAHIAADVLAEGQHTLLIVNTKKQALELTQEFVPHASGILLHHLSTRLKPVDTRKRVEEIQRHLLQQERQAVVVSTQLVEAGVDIDFPRAWREIAPLPSLVQAAGRCNRRGLMKTEARVTIFRPENHKTPPDLYQNATIRTEYLLRDLTDEEIGQLDHPDLLRQYSRRFLTDMASRLDDKQINDKRKFLRLEDCADTFSLVEDNKVSVLVMSDAREQLAPILRSIQENGRASQTESRILAQHSVGITQRELERHQHLLENAAPDILVWPDDLYSPLYGLLMLS